MSNAGYRMLTLPEFQQITGGTDPVTVTVVAAKAVKKKKKIDKVVRLIRKEGYVKEILYTTGETAVTVVSWISLGLRTLAGATGIGAAYTIANKK